MGYEFNKEQTLKKVCAWIERAEKDLTYVEHTCFAKVGNEWYLRNLKDYKELLENYDALSEDDNADLGWCMEIFGW